MNDTTLIVDFDMTISQVEALDQLSRMLDKKRGTEYHPQITGLTELGMQGKITFQESLEERLKVLNFTKSDIQALVILLKQNISPSFQRNIKKLQEELKNFYVISGGFIDFIAPVLEDFGVPSEHVFANQFTFDENNNCIGFDTSNILSMPKGKALLTRELNLDGNIIAMGDGFTDYEMKSEGAANKFFAYVENIRRPELVELADDVIESFDDLNTRF